MRLVDDMDEYMNLSTYRRLYRWGTVSFHLRIAKWKCTIQNVDFEMIWCFSWFYYRCAFTRTFRSWNESQVKKIFILRQNLSSKSFHNDLFSILSSVSACRELLAELNVALAMNSFIFIENFDKFGQTISLHSQCFNFISSNYCESFFAISTTAFSAELCTVVIYFCFFLSFVFRTLFAFSTCPFIWNVEKCSKYLNIFNGICTSFCPSQHWWCERA